MLALINVFYDIAMRRKGPEDLPASGFLFALVLLVYLIINALYFAAKVDVGRLLSYILVNIGFSLSWFWLLLSLYKRRSRFLQTITALLGTGTLITLLALVFIYWYEAVESNEQVAMIPVLGLQVVVIWSIIITGHILHRALEMKLIGGVILAMLYWVIGLSLTSYLFPVPA